MFTARALRASNIMRAEIHREPQEMFIIITTNDNCRRIITREIKYNKITLKYVYLQRAILIMNMTCLTTNH